MNVYYEKYQWFSLGDAFYLAVSTYYAHPLNFFLQFMRVSVENSGSNEKVFLGREWYECTPRIVIMVFLFRF